MIQTLEEIKTSIAQLPSDQRSELASYLLDSLDEEESTIRDEWIALAERRMADVEAGRVQGIPAQEVLRILSESPT